MKRTVKRVEMSDIPVAGNGSIVPVNTLERMACGDNNAVADCSRIHGPLIWAWAKRFTASANAAEAATHAILTDILASAPGFDSAKCSELTYIKQICIRHLMSV